MVYEEHIHHPIAKQWFEHPGGELVFCRQTQAGLLRLLTQPKVMGDGVLDPTEAWEIYRNLCTDIRVSFEPEPSNVEALWITLSVGAAAKTNHWTDAYLAAFAIERGHSFVTFDKGFRRFPALDLTLLEA